MIADLPTSLLRSFVAVVDCGSLAAAAARLNRSESALSLQMARLQDVVGQRLFDRDGRALKLNQAGSRLLGHARAILERIDAARADIGAAPARPERIGIVQDFVPTVLGPVLAELRQADPDVAVEILVGSTAELLQALGEDRLDVALCAGDLLTGGDVARLPMAWFGDPVHLEASVLPLVTVAPPCPFLEAARSALDRAGRAWRLAVVTPSLDGVRSAVEAGLGLACRTAAGLGLPPLETEGRLPALPQIRYGIAERRRGGAPDPASAAGRLAAHLARVSAP